MKSKALFHYKKTSRLIIRPLALHDFENWRQAYSSQNTPQNEWDESNWKDSELTLKKFKEQLKLQLKLRSQDKTYAWGVFRKDDGVLIGLVDLMDISRGLFQNAYLGYRIFNNFWNQGYATEACQAVLTMAFKELKLHRIEAGISPSNKSSLKVAKRIGLRKEGRSPRRLYIDKKWQDMILFAATSEDFGLHFRFVKK